MRALEHESSVCNPIRCAAIRLRIRAMTAQIEAMKSATMAAERETAA
jgi:hypothetical protein